MNLFRRKSFILFIISYLIIINGIMFVTIKSISEFNCIFDLTNSLNNNYLYTFNYNVERQYKDYNGKNIKYKWDYVEIDGEYNNVLFTTLDGVDNGIPYFNGSYMFFLNYDGLVEKEEYIKIDKYSVNNYFFKYDFNIDFIYIYDDVVDIDFDIVVYDYVSSNIRDFYGYNSVCYSGKFCKDLIISSIDTSSYLLIAISCISVIISLFAIYFLLNYFLELEKDVILINYIYYISKKQLIRKYKINIGVSILFINLGINILLYLIFNLNKLLYSFIIGMIYSIIELIVINFIVDLKMKKHLRFNEWRYYNDSY